MPYLSKKTELSLSADSILLLDNLIEFVKLSTEIKCNRSMLSRVIVFYFSSCESEVFHNIIMNYEIIAKEQRDRKKIRYIKATLTDNSRQLLAIMSHINVGFKLHWSGIIRVGIYFFHDMDRLKFMEIFMRHYQEK